MEEVLGNEEAVAELEATVAIGSVSELLKQRLRWWQREREELV